MHHFGRWAKNPIAGSLREDSDNATWTNTLLYSGTRRNWQATNDWNFNKRDGSDSLGIMDSNYDDDGAYYNSGTNEYAVFPCEGNGVTPTTSPMYEHFFDFHTRRQLISNTAREADVGAVSGLFFARSWELLGYNGSNMFGNR